MIVEISRMASPVSDVRRVSLTALVRSAEQDRGLKVVLPRGAQPVPAGAFNSSI